MSYWVLELVEEFMRASAPDADAREVFLHRALSKIAPLYSRLSGLQRAAIARLATELGWPLGSLGIETESIVADDLATQLQGLRVAIYPLTESSSRQAKAAIEEVASTAIVDCNAHHGGTARLRALAENVDLFVMSWLSAKHAATDFIRKHRGGRLCSIPKLAGLEHSSCQRRTPISPASALTRLREAERKNVCGECASLRQTHDKYLTHSGSRKVSNDTTLSFHDRS